MKLSLSQIEEILRKSKEGKSPEQIAQELSVKAKTRRDSAAATVYGELSADEQKTLDALFEKMTRIAQKHGWVRAAWNVQKVKSKKDESDAEAEPATARGQDSDVKV